MTSTTPRAAKLAILSHDNTRGFPALPNELYSEILSHLPAFSLPQDVWVDKESDPYRQLVLFNLTQTCRSLREFFLRYAWERIEVFRGMWAQRDILHHDYMLFNEILRQFKTVDRNPDLRNYVTTVNITIPTFSQSPVIAQNLSLLPNLHTLQLIFLFKFPSQKLFSEFRFPTVHTLILSTSGPHEDILLACPNTRHFAFYENLGCWQLLRYSTRGYASNIEKLGLMTNVDLPELVRNFPRLCDLSLHRSTMRSSNVNFNCLLSLPLHTIRIRLDDEPSCWYCPATLSERQSWIDMAMGVLARCPQNEVAKRVIVVNHDKTVDTLPCSGSVCGTLGS